MIGKVVLKSEFSRVSCVSTGPVSGCELMVSCSRNERFWAIGSLMLGSSVVTADGTG